MSEYYDDIENRARDFVKDNKDNIIEAMVNEFDDLFDDDEILDALSCDLPPMTVSDAAIAVEESVNEADDPGLWEGLNPMDAIISMGTYTMEMDIRDEIQEIYRDMYSEYEDAMLEDDEKDDWDNRDIAEKIFKEWAQEDEVPKGVPGSQGEKSDIERWLEMNRNAGLRGGYPLGHAYIDMRCGTGYSQPDQLRYVNFDNNMGAMYPHLSGKYTHEVKAYYYKTFGDQDQKAEA